ncbi:uncharacterized protein CTHT_0001960 [Thermochaetoides thermophila DSM 1495]|uniref:tRNA wybutosine-synthesizing protein 2 n=1 Tax=Chaetomium thermophilum (strain DSM 1495 / CBS 144.50 / IMI 039719) TaxID=759272 RepID=G0RZ75_CHATD|nr:hypothetical protein CTHT_0001960 [Thermochaetoides thermophila DSM 1495]EGS23503.1 hypothetical protein CTHT_0001960 [Thermochaetoides thermophila DSM 1495]
MSRPQKKKEKPGNPVLSAIGNWLDSLPSSILESVYLSYLRGDLDHEGGAAYIRQQLLDRAPKRWVVYEPMVLLPSGSFTSAPWPALLSILSPSQKDALWAEILHQLSPTTKGASKPTHLAVNEGIPLQISSQREGVSHQQENILRSPSGLKPLFGSFGPCNPPSPPSQTDFDAALWVSTKQNGIIQTWAPLHIMFSRGNVKEKARLLNTPAFKPSCGKEKFAVDLYAGIGYFAFSYARLGLRVLCWELNPWSVEGLRRGAELNGWEVRVIDPSKEERQSNDEELLAREVLAEEKAQILVFLESNVHAAARIRRLREKCGLDIVHVNCGFLPTSALVWKDAWDMVRDNESEGGWLHLHENVGESDIETRRMEVQGLVSRWGEEGIEKRRRGAVEHVEKVKTFAPGVWHCVFDVRVTDE